MLFGGGDFVGECWGVIWARLLVPATARTNKFWTRCSLAIFRREMNVVEDGVTVVDASGDHRTCNYLGGILVNGMNVLCAEEHGCDGHLPRK